MPTSTKKGGKKGRKIGRDTRKPKHVKYNNMRQRERNKIKRMLKSNGIDFTKTWALKNDAMGIYHQLTS